MTGSLDSAPIAPHAAADGVSVRRWFAVYGLYLLAAAVPLAVLLGREPWSWADWLDRPRQLLPATSPAVKLLAFAVYISLCCTFLPLPANWIVAAVAMRDTAVADTLWGTTLLVAAVGALASTVANLNDYHLFTWLLRSRRIGRVRRTRVYRAAARWFARSPFFLVTLFNIIPIPVDVIRMLATTFRYPRLPFAAANFLGRFVRYGVIAGVTWALGREGKWAVLALLATAVALGAAKVLPGLFGRIFARGANPPAAEVSNTAYCPEEIEP